MKLKFRNKLIGKVVIGYFLLFAVLVGLALIYTGFLYTDKFALYRFGKKYLILLWIIRIGFPIFIISIFAIVYSVKKGVLSFSNIMLAFISLIICVFISYPALNYILSKMTDLDQKRKMYHPFLQLTPPTVTKVSKEKSDQVTIFCIGGSTTEFTDDQNIGWPKRVEKILRKNNGNKVKIYNLGRQWYTTLHSLINFETNLRHHEPDIIIVMHGINDLLNNADFSYFSHGIFREDYGHFYGPVDRLITGRSPLGEIWEKIDFWYPKKREIVDQNKFPGINAFKHNLNTLIDLAEKDEIKVVLMTQPFLLKETMKKDEKDVLYMLNVEAVGPNKEWSFDTALRGLKAYNKATRQVAKSRNVHLIDLERDIPKTLEYFWDDVHYTTKAFEKISKIISHDLESSVLLR